MYKVLIADDEMSMRETLERSLPWKEMEMEIVYCAKNGREALEVADRIEIDIAILDIRMPGMNGLEVCEALRRKKENIQLIIISGYAEFSYAERAMEFGALGYCLKPLDYEKLRKLLMKAQSAIRRSQGELHNSSLMEVLESGEEEELAKVLQALSLDPQELYICVSVGKINTAIPDRKAVLQIGRDQYGYLMNHPFVPEHIPSDVRQKVSGIGYERKPVTMFQIQDGLFQCRVRAFQFFVEEDNVICGESNTDDAGFVLHTFSEEISRKNWDAVCGLLLTLRDEGQKQFDITSSVRLNNLIYSCSLFRDADSDYYIYDFHQLVSEYGTFSKMTEKLEQAVRNAVNSGTNGEYSNAAFMKLLSYIEDNYHGDISLTGAAEALHMNPNYVSRMFKKEAGVTFVHYITQMRMREAGLLLTTTKRPVVDIAMEVGFNDYFYFLKTFKKWMKKTPSQYRGE